MKPGPLPSPHLPPTTKLQPAQLHGCLLQVLSLVISTIVLAESCLAPQAIDKDLSHVHATLAAFARRGQMSIESALPLLSTMFAAERNTIPEVLLLIARIAVGRAVLRRWSAVASFAMLLAWNWQVDVGKGGLSMTWCLGDLAICLALLDGPTWLWSEGLVLVGYAFGSSENEACVAYILLFGRRLGELFRKVADTSISMKSLVFSASFRILVSVLIWPTVFLIATGALMSFAEDAAGGNYNLQYLSPAARRSITPFGSITNMLIRPLPFGVVDSREMYTLYIPGAGFLWSDEMVWAQSVPDGEDYEVEGSDRVFFQDKFGERYPWIVEVKNAPEPKRKKRSKPGIVRSGSLVRIRSWTSKDYLCLVPGERVTSEAGYFVDEERFGKASSSRDLSPGESKLQRVRVGNLPTPCDWTIYYDPTEDNGVAFYNSVHSCSLATTFRSLPTESTTNDTIRRTLGSQTEASCTVNANDASSRFHLVDGSTAAGRPSYRSSAYSNRPSFLQRGWYVLQARKTLGEFRSRHADDSVPVPRPGGPISSQLNHCLPYALLIVSLISCLVRRRYPATTSILNPPAWETLFVGVQIFSGGASESRVSGIVALNGLMRSLAPLFSYFGNSDTVILKK